MAEATAGHPAAGRTAAPGLRRALADLPAADRVGLVTAMTLVLLLLFSGGGWYVQAPVAVLGAAGLLLPPLRRSSWFWLGLGALLFAGFLYEWSIVDNHQYLYVYWCLALGLALRTAEPGAQLAVSARWLVALCFLSATIWKALSPDFLDGSFFHQALLVDSRLQWAAEHVAGLPGDVNAANRRALGSLLGYSAEVAPIELRSSPTVAALARILAWATLAIEGLIAFAFAGPARWPLGRLRAPLLLAFVLSTYALAPVIGFGWILLILGLAQAPDRGPIPTAYVVAFLVLPLYRVPWRELLAGVG
ncbi:MAG TPA: hypothetical protein VMR44_10735 [Thermoanaerobaculia bacterium]|nr:hypothetical protein [Thermoanaerobaculia bacterium]